jgi:hypothetical protein
MRPARQAPGSWTRSKQAKTYRKITYIQVRMGWIGDDRWLRRI